jgi:putative transcriptional regulator
MTFEFMDKVEFKTHIGQSIIAQRSKKGWTQSELARACNKDRQAIEKLEKGKVNPTIYTLYEISKALEVSLRELISI